MFSLPTLSPFFKATFYTSLYTPIITIINAHHSGHCPPYLVLHYLISDIFETLPMLHINYYIVLLIQSMN